MKRYPLGVQSFEKIIQGNYVYVDKTRLVYELANGPAEYIFLSRPRRFGKTLLTTTLKAYFEGKKELFKGLAMEKLEQDWTQYPVLHFSLNGFKRGNIEALERYLMFLLKQEEERFGIEGREPDVNTRLVALIVKLHNMTGRKVVVLIDEYDSPLLDVAHEDVSLTEVRTVMRNFYSPLKMCEEHLRFVFLTGITKFSQLSIFSAFNNIKNISMDPAFATLCGISEEELQSQMREGVEEMAKALELSYDQALLKLKERYDGYRFAWPSPGLCNPYSLLNALSDKRLSDYWFASGTPTYLIELLRKYPVDTIDLATALESPVDGFDVPVELMKNSLPLFFQSGYLTIKGYDPQAELYVLGMPNGEVRQGLLKSLLPLYVEGFEMEGHTTALKMRRFFLQDKPHAALQLLQTYLKTVPQTNHTGYEGHWQQMLYIIFSLTGFKVDVEYPTPTGRIDLVLYTPLTTYIIECKVRGSAEAALQQIITRDYPARFALGPRSLTLIGLSFSIEERNLIAWAIEPCPLADATKA